MSALRDWIIQQVNLLYLSAWSADPKVRLKQTFPYTTTVNNYKTVVVEKDKDCYLACVVDNKPADKKVSHILLCTLPNKNNSLIPKMVSFKKLFYGQKKKCFRFFFSLHVLFISNFEKVILYNKHMSKKKPYVKNTDLSSFVS